MALAGSADGAGPVGDSRHRRSQDAGGGAVWSDEQFEDVLKTADGDFAAVQNHRVRLPAEVRKKGVWRIAVFRADPCAPGGHEAIRKDLGEKPQLRLILQPVTVNQGAVTVHDIAVHAVFTFVIKGEGQVETPDRKRFQDIVHDLDALKAFGAPFHPKQLFIHGNLQRREETIAPGVSVH